MSEPKTVEEESVSAAVTSRAAEKPAEPAVSEVNDVVLTALSASVFAIIGGIVGRSIGKLGDHESRQIGRRVGTWAGAIISGSIAGYSVYHRPAKPLPDIAMPEPTVTEVATHAPLLSEKKLERA